MSVVHKQLLVVTPDAVENIRKSYDLDNPNRLNDAIKILEEWIQKQDHIINKDYSKEYLERELISCKGSVEKAKTQIDRLCTMKTLMPQFFTKTNVKLQLKHITDIAYVVPLPVLTEDFYRVVVIKFNKGTITADYFLEFYQYCVIITEYVKKYDYPNGFILIEDLRDLNLVDIVSKLNTVELQRLITLLIEGYGARLKAVHVLTASKTIEILLKIIKQLISEKIANRIHVHNTMEELQEVLPNEIMPLDYGGNQRPLYEIHEDWLDEVSTENYIEYLKKTYTDTVDESKRCNGKFNEDYLGMPGSFRHLSVD